MTNETPPFARLDEREANEMLCQWLNERTGSDLNAEDGVLFDDEWPEYPYFSRDHSQIHRVLDAMDTEERKEFVDVAALVRGLGFIVFLTPAQKTVAALRALGLQRESPVETTPEQPKVSAIGHFATVWGPKF